LKVHQLDTINSVKKQISKMGIQLDQQRLKFDGRVLENGFTLTDYNINAKSTIHLVSTVQIVIKSSRDKNITFEAETNHTIYQVKNMIHDKVGIPPVQQRLTSAEETRLEDQHTLIDYNMKGREILHLTLISQIVIKDLNGKTITMEMKPTDTIFQVKMKIQEEENINLINQQLIHDGKELSDNCTLFDYNIVNGCCLQLVWEHGMQIFVKVIPLCMTYTLEVYESDTVHNVKMIIKHKMVFQQLKEIILPDQQKLIFNGKVLHDNVNFNDYKIPENSIIDLVFLDQPQAAEQ